ncbi:hypothetical protein [Halobellus ruber]|uniref:Uncharacterized protein n=1 Tax=Halobellus ruber TaxID=2761102 RepID=A0A7J9SH72_9EURY|nr:hypothetical protein [Halobellus ruber]MBB6646314.1 hypothetical protein [Halobellus ruber]
MFAADHVVLRVTSQDLCEEFRESTSGSSMSWVRPLQVAPDVDQLVL